MNIPDEAVEAAARAIAESGLTPGWWNATDAGANGIAKALAWPALSAALPAIERAHLERLTAEAEADKFKAWPQGLALNDLTYEDAEEHDLALHAHQWLRARLDQTKEKP